MSSGTTTPPAIGRHLLLTGMVLFLLVWGLFSWPLPRHFLCGIPSADRNVEKYHAREMIAGDHLQLMYHFWLASDMLRGKTPLFSNLYEFNTGNDAARRHPDPYYLPFSLVYAVFAPLGGQALGWNMAGIATLLLGFWATWLLARRYTRDPLIPLFAALIATMQPYRWITLLTGSPTGFAMGLVPVILLGLDIAVRNRRAAGGLLAGVGILSAYAADLHVFYFSVLCVPVWCLIALAAGETSPLPLRRSLPALTRALLPTALLILLAAWISHRLSMGFEGTDMADGRTFEEVGKFSPFAVGLFSWRNVGTSNHVFFGSVMLAGLLFSGIAMGTAFRKGRSTAQSMLVFLLLAAAIGTMVVLALGTHAPGEGLPIRICRQLIPRYNMIRQPVKIYCLLPTFLAIAMTLGMDSLRALQWPRRRFIAISTIALLLLAGEWRKQISPTICLLRAGEPAYAAVEKDSRDAGHAPHVLILPLWPGDSHWTSLYEYYVSLYRIRMVNGYSPVKNNRYVTEVFHALESANLGILDDTQLAQLTGMGVRHLIFHQDAFPDQVSPFPASLTLKRLLEHPRLELLHTSESIRAFRILEAGQAVPRPALHWPYIFSNRGWDLSRTLQATAQIIPHAAAVNAFVTLPEGDTWIHSRPVPAVPNTRIALRAQGTGSLTCDIMDGDTRMGSHTLSSDTPTPLWNMLPFTPQREGFDLSLRLTPTEGTLLLDQMFLVAGAWQGLEPGETATIPAACFYHAGFTEIETLSVVLRQHADPDRVIFYGSFVPMDPGTYVCIVETETTAPPGTVVAHVQLNSLHSASPLVPIKAGHHGFVAFEKKDDLPCRLNLLFTRKADLRIKRVILRRTQ